MGQLNFVFSSDLQRLNAELARPGRQNLAPSRPDNEGKQHLQVG